MNVKRTTSPRRTRSTSDPAALRTRLLVAWEQTSAVFTTLDEVGAYLPEPERGACLELRNQAADLARRLGNLAAFVGGAP